MSIHELAGKPAPRYLLENIPRLVSAYYTQQPDPSQIDQRVSFGTSGHRGTSNEDSFNEDHILAISQAIVEYRQQNGITGPLFLGMDTHALSEAAHTTAIEVFAANGVKTYYQQRFGYTPTPAISHAILTFNKEQHLKGTGTQADGVVITPSHNPPGDGGFKYNPPSGGPADTGTTSVIQARANQILEEGVKSVRRITFNQALKQSDIIAYDFLSPYVKDLSSVVNMDIIAQSGIKIGVDPMGGAGIKYWAPIAERYHLNLHLVNEIIDPTFAFMTVDKDGKIRMDCSSPYAMASLINLREDFDIAFGNDPDYDRHGIVTRKAGLMNPNHFLSVAIWYLFQNRPQWRADIAVGKTLVSSSMIDRVANHLGRKLAEVPVGFKWFVDGLLDGTYGFGGEESAGASFLRHNGTVWTTDKDGIIMGLLAAEILSSTGKDPGDHYAHLEGLFGSPVYQRFEAPANRDQKQILANLKPEMISAQTLAGEPIIARITHAPANQAPIGGLKIVTENGWFAARPSGTEDIYKIYAESFLNKAHVDQIQAEAQDIVSSVF